MKKTTMLKPVTRRVLSHSFAIVTIFTMCAATSLTTSSLSANDDAQWVVYEGGEGPGKGKHVVLVSGDDEYRSEEALPMLGKILAKHHGFKCTVLFAINPEDGTIKPDYQNNIPGLEALDDADLMIMALRFRELPDDQMKHIVDFMNAGKPIIGLRTSTHAFNYRDKENDYAKYSFNSREPKGGFGQAVLGDTWINHHGAHGRQSTRGVINPKFESSAIVKGCEDIWGPSDVYGIRNLTDDADVLVYGQVLKGMDPSDEPLEGAKNDPMMPVAWTKSYVAESGEEGLAFCTTMGASTDLQSEGLRRLVVNASYWAVGMEDDIPARANVEYVDDYNPTDFGFGSFQKGLRPSDFELK